MRSGFSRGAMVVAIVAVLAALAVGGCSGVQGQRDGLHAQVPDVTGQRLQAATDELKRAGYGLGEVTWTDATTQPKGVVVSQNPIGGTSVARGESIDLVVAGSPKTVP